MRWVLLVLFLVAGCASPAPKKRPRPAVELPPLPPDFPPHLKSLAVPQAAPAAIVPPAKGGYVKWKYPTNINTEAYWYNLESTTNMKTWVVEQTNVTGDVLVQTTNAFKFFRLRGRLVY